MSDRYSARWGHEQFDRCLQATAMTVKQFADRTGIDVTTVYRWRREDQFPKWVPLLLNSMWMNKRRSHDAGRLIAR